MTKATGQERQRETPAGEKRETPSDTQPHPGTGEGRDQDPVADDGQCGPLCPDRTPLVRDPWSTLTHILTPTLPVGR